jgi:AcrR family transcriptional regulator
MSTVDPTKSRLLEAAGEEFAEKGFEDARVRSICQRAGLKNQAAVNYHFGDKEKLYYEALLEAHRCGAAVIPISTPAGASPEEELRSYIGHFLRSVIQGRQAHGWHSALLLREMIRPTAACEALVREMIRPRFERLQAILRRICPDAEDRRLHALAFSVIGQCLHYKFAETVASRLVGPEAWAALDADFLADHIATFSLAAFGLVPPLDSSGNSIVTTDEVTCRS